MWSIAHAEVIEAVVELNTISHVTSLHWAQTTVPWKQFVLVRSHIIMQKIQKCKENSGWIYWFLRKGRPPVDPPVTSDCVSYKQVVHHTGHAECLNTPCVCYTVLELCVSVCVRDSHWAQAGLPSRPLAAWKHEPETHCFTGHMPQSTFVCTSGSNWFVTTYVLSQYRAEDFKMYPKWFENWTKPWL